jgi:glycosyltransferase involved in cell wall biosynthesis
MPSVHTDLLSPSRSARTAASETARTAAAVQLSLVVPCYNEEEVLRLTLPRLLGLLSELHARGLVTPESSIVFVDDGSRDATWRLIEEAHEADPRVHGIKLTCNRGHQNALLAGLMCSSAEVTVSLDADLQDDPTAIARMLDAHRGGADIVFGVRARRDTDTWFKRTSARAYYGLLRRLGVHIVPGHADFRLMSRRSLEALRDFREVNLFLRGIVPLLGFRTATVSYDRAARAAGESKYPLHRMIALGLEGVFSFSTVPLRWITWLGISVSIASIGFGLWAVFIRLFTERALPGWASTVVPMFFLGGVQLLALGVIGAYLSRVYAETKQRPRFIVDKSV